MSRTGSDSAGTVYHALPLGQYTAVCGKTYGRRSAGWSDYYGKTVTCPKCIKKMAKALVPFEVIA